MLASEKCQQLADQDVDHGSILIADGCESGTLDSNVALSQHFFRNIFADHQLSHPEFFLLEFEEQVGLECAKRRIGRKEAHDKSVVVGKAHWSVTEAKIRFAHRGNASGGSLQHLERTFASRAE